MTARAINELLAAAAATARRGASDFLVAGALGPGFVALARSGNAAFLVPLREVTSGVGRFAAGLSLVPQASVEFNYAARLWTQPAAVLECTNSDMLNAFVALIADLAQRLPQRVADVQWSRVLQLVDEWQAMLASRGRLSPDRELGLWGELWVIAGSNDPDALVASWRGPEASAFDFLYAGVSIEVKASKRRHEHDISLSQVERPAGGADAFVLSIWANIDPKLGLSLPEMFRRVSERVSDQVSLLRTASKVGYVPGDDAAYTARYVALEQPWWVHVTRVPRVRTVDPGVSRIRYVIKLDESMRSDGETEARLWSTLGHTPDVAESS